MKAKMKLKYDEIHQIDSDDRSFVLSVAKFLMDCADTVAKGDAKLWSAEVYKNEVTIRFKRLRDLNEFSEMVEEIREAARQKSADSMNPANVFGEEASGYAH